MVVFKETLVFSCHRVETLRLGEIINNKQEKIMIIVERERC